MAKHRIVATLKGEEREPLYPKAGEEVAFLVVARLDLKMKPIPQMEGTRARRPLWCTPLSRHLSGRFKL